MRSQDRRDATPDNTMRATNSLAAAAQVAVAAGDWPAAASAFEQLASCLDPLPAAIAYNAGVAHRRAGHLAAAIDWLDRTLEATPDHLNARYERAAACMDAGRHRAALADFEAYLEFAPEDRDAALNRARLLVSLGRWNDAEVAWSARLDAQPDDREARLAYLAVLAETGHHQALLDRARALLSADQTTGAEIIRHLTHAGRGMFPLRATALKPLVQDATARATTPDVSSLCHDPSLAVGRCRNLQPPEEESQ